jgi:hypothetical protein
MDKLKVLLLLATDSLGCICSTSLVHNCPLELVKVVKRQELHISKKPSMLESLHSLSYFCDGPIKMAHCKPKKKKLGGTPSN